MVRYNVSLLDGKERPKPVLIKEDADFFYHYNRDGTLKSVDPKSREEQYSDFLRKTVIYRLRNRPYSTGTMNNINITDMGAIRLTPASDYEIALGLGAFNPVEASSGGQCRGCTGGGRLFHSNPMLESVCFNDYVTSFPDIVINGKCKPHTSLNSVLHEAKEVKKEEIHAQQERERIAWEKAEQQRLAKLREARPKKETVFVAPPEPVEIEPIKEAVKYSPLLIAGVVVVIVLFLRRRA